MSKKTSVIAYLGDGSSFHAGIPACDLTPDQYAALDTDQRATVRASDLYDYAAFHDAQKSEKDPAAPAASGGGA